MLKETKAYIKKEPDKMKGDKNKLSFISKVVQLYDEQDDYMRVEAASITMTLKDDFAIVLSDDNGEGYIYLYPEQVAHLKYLLDQIK